MARLPLNVSESTRRLNPLLYGGHQAVRQAVKNAKRVRQDPRPLLNGLESEWLAVLVREYGETAVLKQALRFRLGNGVWYKPDFAVLCPAFTCWEVKGKHAFRGGFENLKVAAGLYPGARWVLVWKEESTWRKQIVLP